MNIYHASCSKQMADERYAKHTPYNTVKLLTFLWYCFARGRLIVPSLRRALQVRFVVLKWFVYI